MPLAFESFGAVSDDVVKLVANLVSKAASGVDQHPVLGVVVVLAETDIDHSPGTERPHPDVVIGADIVERWWSK